MRRSAIVIGGGRGIGAATATLLAADGHDVTIVDRGADDLRLPYPLASVADIERSAAAAKEVATGGEVVGVAADACDEGAIRRVVEEVAARTGGLDVMVVTAGVIAGGVPVWELPEAELDALLDVDLRAVIIAARAGIPAMRRRPEPRAGRFVAVASAAAHRGLPMLSVYGAAKAGVVGFVRGLAAELRATGITANTVSPGSTDTAMLVESARLYALSDAREFIAHQPIGRLIEPAEIAAVISFLAGESSGAITGADHVVDGGLTI